MMKTKMTNLLFGRRLSSFVCTKRNIIHIPPKIHFWLCHCPYNILVARSGSKKPTTIMGMSSQYHNRHLESLCYAPDDIHRASQSRINVMCKLKHSNSNFPFHFHNEKND